MPGPADKRAPFITLEGGEGAGKTTQLELLAERIGRIPLPVSTTFEPGGNQMGSALRQLLSDASQIPISPKAELLMYLADRAQHVETEILPHLSNGVVVICDRFSDSSEVYQGRARGLGREEVRRLNRWVCGEVWPDLTLLLDLDPKTGLGRVRKRQGDLGLDRMELEALEFHEAVRRGFLEQAEAEPERIKVIDASRDEKEVARRIWEHAKAVIDGWLGHAA